MRTDFDAQWEQLAEEVMSGMKEWRLQHPKASLREIERALDERLGKMRARMVAGCGIGEQRSGYQGSTGGREAGVPARLDSDMLVSAKWSERCERSDHYHALFAHGGCLRR